MYVDLDELPELARVGLGCARRSWGACFVRADHLGDPRRPLDACVRELVEQRTGGRPNGPIRLLTGLRQLGVYFDPLTLYYCFDESGQRLSTVVARVSNTPWNERHEYVLDLRDGRSARHAKQFHVSPFMSMDMTYQWRFTMPGQRLGVSIANLDASGRLFSASLAMRRAELTSANLRRMQWLHPFSSVRMIAAIYHQALRLWMKRCPFYPHPRH
jgi:DUF1365 family protein